MLLRPQSLGQAGKPPEPPAGFQYPTLEGYASKTVQALGDIGEDWARDNMVPPVAAAVMTTKNVIAGAAGEGFMSLLDAAGSGKMTFGKAAQIAQAVGALLDGSLEIVSAGAQAAKLSSMAQAVPVLGSIVGAVVQIAVEALTQLASFEQAKSDVERALHEYLAIECRNQWEAARPFPTGPAAAVTPADFFRKLGFAYQSWIAFGKKQGHTGGGVPWPMNSSSMYLMLCGGETQGFGLSRHRYNQLLDAHRKRNPQLGIAPSTQRRMWRLLQGLFATVQAPIAEHPIGDQGRALMPALIEIVRTQYLRKTWDDTFARALSDEVTSRYKHRITYQPPGAAGVIERVGTCKGQQHGVTGRHIDLSDGLIQSVTSFQADIWNEFWDASTQQWRVVPTSRVLSPVRGVLQLSPAQAQKALSDIKASTHKGSLATAVMALVAASAAGYGAYRAIRASGVKLG